MYKILDEVNQIIDDYYSRTIEIVEGLHYSQYRKIRMVEFYSNSEYETGSKDSLGREKPFYNIVNTAVKVSKTAADIDTKDIQVEADEGKDYDKSFILSKDIYQWMKATKFAEFLNEMGDVRPRYGGVLVKKCIEEDEGEKKLKLEIPEWKNVITDPVDILGGVIIEKHWMSPAKLSKMSDVWENVSDALKLASKDRTDANGNTSTVSVNKVPILEIRGEFKKAYLTTDNPDSDDTEYSLQKWIVAGDTKGKQVILYKKEIDEQEYKYKEWEKRAGRGLGVGVVEEGEQAQVWTNDAIMKKRDAMEITAKAIGQTASKKLKGRNLLTETDNGTILEHEDNKPISVVQLMPSGGLAQFDNLATQWFTQYERVTSTYDAVRGETPPSGTPFRLQALNEQAGGSQFDLHQENAGNFLVEIFNDWIIPFLSKKLDKAHILSHEFSADELKEIDKNFSIHNANMEAKKRILSGQKVTPEEYDAFQSEFNEFISQTKGKRFLDIPDGYYKNLQAKVTINITGEQKNKAAMLETLKNIIELYSANPGLTQDPVLTPVFMKLIEMSGSGISPIQIMAAIEQKNEALKASPAMAGTAPELAGMTPQATPPPTETSLQTNPVPANA